MLVYLKQRVTALVVFKETVCKRRQKAALVVTTMVFVQNLFQEGFTEALQKLGYVEILLLVLLWPLTSLLILSKRAGRKERFPPGPFAWPLVGHVHHFANLPHQTCRDLSQRYGPMLGLRLGQKKAVVISSPELAREVLLTHDKVFANRPPHDYTSVLLYGYTNDLLFGPHGPQWRKQRKLCFMSLFTAKRLQELENIRQEEIASLLLHLINHTASAGIDSATAPATPIDIGLAFGNMACQIVMRLLVSKASLQLGDENLVDLVKEFEQELSFPSCGDFFPYLSFLDNTRKQQMRRLHDRFDKAFSAVVADRKENANAHDDLLEALLSKEAGRNPAISPQETFSINQIKATFLNMLGAGIHTTSLTLEWAMAELLRNPDCFQRLRQEIDAQLGKKKQITDADLPNLSYLKCVVKEVLRLHPIAPLLLPRISNAQCEVNGYTLPANTHMFVNVWAIHRDETVWEHAHEFMPQRFEGKHIDMKGQSFELLPFGSGRRVCVGLPMALSVVEVTIANLVNSFDWELPHGESHTSINMAEKKGITANKATPLMVIPKPRVSDVL